MEYITTKEAAERWGISPTRITILAGQGRILGVRKLGKNWLIPADTTKPADGRKNRGHCTAEIPVDGFSFPLYPYRPDLWPEMESSLSMQEKKLLAAENAVLACQFKEAYAMLGDILNAPDSIGVELCALWNAAICTVALNRLYDFSGIYLRLLMRLAEDPPHRDNYAILLDSLKTYTEPIGSYAGNASFYTGIHYQCLPLMCMQVGYSHLAREAIKIGSADSVTLELILRFLETTNAVIAKEYLHCYLLGIYYLRHEQSAAEQHAKAAVELAYQHQHYFSLVTYFRYFSPVLSPILAQYPAEFQAHFQEVLSLYTQNFDSFLKSLSQDSVFVKLSSGDYPYLGVALQDLPNKVIAEKLGVSEHTVKRRLNTLCTALGVRNKKELRECLRSYL